MITLLHVEQLLSGFSISELINPCNMGVDLNELFTHNLVLTHKMNVIKLEFGTLKISESFGTLMDTFILEFVVEQLLVF